MLKDPPRLRIYVIAAVILAGVFACVGLLVYQRQVVETASRLLHFLSDRNKISTYVSSFGSWAPMVFMLIQILQVVFAPIPGEMTGFVGGYLFGVWPGFVYSSIALTVGSLINFSVGRFLGKRFVRRLIPSKHLKRLDAVLKHEGALIIFILFVFPGFPKDYLCLFLGLSAIPIKLFIWMSAVGRMPGTFMLSIQGGMLFKENYYLLAAMAGVFCLFVLLSYYYRESFYRWIEKQNNRHGNG